MQINPLNFPGPQFLVFYSLVSIGTLYLVNRKISKEEEQWKIPKLNMNDPYEIAYLRGGESEVLKIATLSLIDRGMLETTSGFIKTNNQFSSENVRRPVEKAILNRYSTSDLAINIFNDDLIIHSSQDYKKSLERSKFIASDYVYELRRPMITIGLWIILGLALVKIFLSLIRGHHNIIFLMILAGIYLIILFSIYKKRTTALGDRVLEDLKNLFKGLNDRSKQIKPGGMTNEAVLLAAVFGFSALPREHFSYLADLFPKASANTSCGSSCGGSCGSGCGGCGGD